MTFKRALLCLLLCLVTLAGSAEYSFDEKQLWKSMTGREAGQELLKLRQRNDPEKFATRFILFLNQGRTTSEILALLRVVGLPLKDSEIEQMEMLYEDLVEHNMLKTGYSLECRATPGTRFSLIFLNNAERQAWKKNDDEGRDALTEHEKKIVDNLEGRLCVWAAKRKIHLGGPRFIYERVKPILSFVDKELD